MFPPVSACCWLVDWSSSPGWVLEVQREAAGAGGEQQVHHTAACGTPGADLEEIFLGTKYSNSSPQYISHNHLSPNLI